jgi:hypothetical protein
VEVDRTDCVAIIAANETHSAEAYYYHSAWKSTMVDPRVYYPDILTDRNNDPRRIAIGCTGEAQEKNPQLVTSNALAAALAGHLYALWALKFPEVDPGVLPRLPYKLVANMTALETYRVSDINKPTKGQNDEQRTGNNTTGRPDHPSTGGETAGEVVQAGGGTPSEDSATAQGRTWE